jgi:anti-sigma factor RsiW
MKTSDFEANFTAWLDGQLDPERVAAFEKEMRARGFDPAAERAEAERTRDLLRLHSAAPELGHADFFQHQLLHRIEQEERAPGWGRAWWGLPRLVWAGAFCLLVAGVLFKTLIPTGSEPLPGDDYFATIVDARTYEPAISVDTVYDPRTNVTVLWLNGLDYMEGDIVAQ